MEKKTLISPKVKKQSGGLWSVIKAILRFFGNFLINKKFCLDELINITRPVIYIYSVLKYGRKSYTPIKISFALDILQLVSSSLRLWRSARTLQKLSRHPEKDSSKQQQMKHLILSQMEIDEVKKRCRLSLLKYLIRDPVFSEYTMPMVMKLLAKLRVPTMFSTYLFAYINYFRYYTFIS